MVTSTSGPCVVVGDMCEKAEPQLPQDLLTSLASLTCPPEMVYKSPKPRSQSLVLHFLSLRSKHLHYLLALMPHIQVVGDVLPAVRF